MFPNASIYPQLFAFDIGNCHGRIVNSDIIKINIYNTLTDKLQKEKNGTPIHFSNISKSISDYANFVNLTRNIIKNIDTIETNFVKKKAELADLLNDIIGKRIGTRAEFRIRLSRINLCLELLRKNFSGESLMNKSMILSSESVSYWCLSNLKQLSDPITDSIKNCKIHLIGDNFELFQKAIITLSVFESLLCSTFFSGRTYSYASELVWKKSSAETKSLELMKSLKIYNRLVVPTEFWNFDESLLLSCPSYQNLIKKISSFSSESFHSNFNLIRILANSKSTELEKAESIWRAYFNELRDEDFIMNNNARWKKNSLINNTEFTLTGIKIISAIENIFKIERLLEEKTAWKKTFLIAFQEWVNPLSGSSPVERIKRCHQFLKEAAEKLDIEFVHYFGENSQRFYGKWTKYRNVINDSVLKKENLTLIQKEIPASTGTLKNLSKQRKEFSEEEVDCLVAGYRKYRDVHFTWLKILEDPEYIFSETKSRSGTQLKDKIRNLEKSKQLVFINGEIVYIPKENKVISNYKKQLNIVPGSQLSNDSHTFNTSFQVKRISESRVDCKKHKFNFSIFIFILFLFIY